jgi:uncharacterized protein (DUF1810 family)
VRLKINPVEQAGFIFYKDMAKTNNLQRFIDAQETLWETALSEIQRGRKRSPWMWFIFPQIQGLGFSSTSILYAIKDQDEAIDFLKHPILGSRLIQISNELLQLETKDAGQIFGSPDNMKLRSCMTLFSSLDDTDPVFQEVLNKYFGGKKDTVTLVLMSNGKF